jgi:hypothetical protein
MTAYLITGEAGTGKSSVATELRRRGYLAYDADATLAYHTDRATGQPITEKLDHYAGTAWMWDAARLRVLLDHRKDVFMTGSSDNQHEFYPLFATIFILTIDAPRSRSACKTADRETTACTRRNCKIFCEHLKGLRAEPSKTERSPSMPHSLWQPSSMRSLLTYEQVELANGSFRKSMPRHHATQPHHHLAETPGSSR